MLLRAQIGLCFLYEVQRHAEVETVLLAEHHVRVAHSPEPPWPNGRRSASAT
ncbi:hypothetical protein [Streptomyces sp. NPDC057889]|uniref:hypothetical protein n=1 Tax=unclassified Streptomyces TaxID=2593676 RepID=UPI0036B5E4E7